MYLALCVAASVALAGLLILGGRALDCSMRAVRECREAAEEARRAANALALLRYAEPDPEPGPDILPIRRV